MRWRPLSDRLSILTDCWCGQRSGSRLSILKVSVAGLYSPPGEILVGRSGGFGETQITPGS